MEIGGQIVERGTIDRVKRRYVCRFPISLAVAGMGALILALSVYPSLSINLFPFCPSSLSNISSMIKSLIFIPSIISFSSFDSHLNKIKKNINLFKLSFKTLHSPHPKFSWSIATNFRYPAIGGRESVALKEEPLMFRSATEFAIQLCEQNTDFASENTAKLEKETRPLNEEADTGIISSQFLPVFHLRLKPD
ncbi:hypothetical protein V2J09_018663 [Rumex salicifolius]